MTPYVGHRFELCFMSADKDPLAVFNGYEGKLIGYKQSHLIITDADACKYNREPGVYRKLGDPFVRLETGQALSIPMLNLRPLTLPYPDSVATANAYENLKRQLVWHTEVPNANVGIGDKILASPGNTRDPDIIGRVVDIRLQGGVLYFFVQHGHKLVSVPHSRIIQVLDDDDFFYKDLMEDLYASDPQAVVPAQVPLHAHADHESVAGLPEPLPVPKRSRRSRHG